MSDAERSGAGRSGAERSDTERSGAEGRGADRLVCLGQGEEFDRIRRILGGTTLPLDGVVVGPGDDGALLEDGTVLTTDLSVEGVHFRLDWITAQEAGFRAAAAGASDLAAMGAHPIALLASAAAPGDGSGAEELMRGVRRFCEAYRIPLVGGDLTRSPGPLLLDIVCVGRTEAPLLRTGARVGDELWVTGPLGGAAGAVALWTAGEAPTAELRAAFAYPSPRIAAAPALVESGATAGLDLSDGIAGDAGHLAAASGVAAVLDLGAIPLHPALEGAPLPAAVDPLALALHGGEDYELLLAAPPGLFEARVEEFRRRFDLSLTRVGWIAPGEGVFVVESPSGEPRPLQRRGYDHFSEGGEGKAGL